MDRLKFIANSQDMIKVTHIGRNLNVRYVPHLMVLIFTLLAGVIGIVAALAIDTTPGTAVGTDLGTALMQGIWSMLGFFITWMFAREIDPDHEYSAFLAGACFLFTLWFTPVSSFGILAMVVLLLSARMVNRMIGPPLTLLDSGIVLVPVLALLLFENWILALVVVVAYALDGLMNPALLRHVGFAVLLGILFTVRVSVYGIFPSGAATLRDVLLLAAISLLYIGTIAGTNRIRAKTDVEGYEPLVARVRAAMFLPLIGGILLFILRAGAGLEALMPAWAAMFAVTVYRLPVTVLRIREPDPTKAENNE